MPTAATPAQLTNITNAINQLNTYIANLQTAQHAAAVAGNLNVVQQLNGAFLDANSLEARLNNLRTISDIGGLSGAITSVKTATTTLDNQKQQIDTLVNAVGVASTVIGDITSVVTAVAAL